MNTSAQRPETATSPRHDNAPGRAALAYRMGTHPTFLRRMLGRLSAQEMPDGKRPLVALATRDLDDPAIALLDAWATVADVFTFYQERIANEGYVRTATEQRSILELARALGYELSPGVAAGTFLAFTVDEAAEAPDEVIVPGGTRVQSIPRQGRLPQTFETSEDIAVRAAWNSLHPRLTQPQAVTGTTRQLYLSGVNTRLQPGDALLLLGDERDADPGSQRWHLCMLQTVTPYPEEGYTLVTWQNEPDDEADGEALTRAKVFALRQQAALFGHNAPDWRSMSAPIKSAYTGNDQWPDFTIRNAHQIDLDVAYPKIVPGSWAVLVNRDGEEPCLALYRAEHVSTAARTDFTLTAKITRIVPDAPVDSVRFGLRETVVFAQSEALALAEQPIPSTEPIQGQEIVLDRVVAGLDPGRAIVITGRLMGSRAEDDEMVNEVAFIAGTSEDGQRTTLALHQPLAHVYNRTTVTLNANVVRATHGETVRAVLGSGDGSRANQRFQLKNTPLTYVAAPTPSGVKSTLDVRVNGVRWHEVPSLYNLDGHRQGYMVRIDNDGKTSVTFGDGESGARLPTGTENVVATYRSGLGPEGEVDAGSLTLLQTRPLGIRAVTNPLPATGAAAPETLERARTNAPLTVLTMGRITSLRDYENFARAFTGIGKAQAVELRSGETRLLHLTVAAVDGERVDPKSGLYANLAAAIDAARAPTREVRIDSYQPRFFNLAARVRVDSDHMPEAVLTDVHAGLLAAFAFERRRFGQDVTASEVIAVIQGMPGVVAADLDDLYHEGQARALALLLPAETARWQDGAIQPAQLLLPDPAGITLKTWEET